MDNAAQTPLADLLRKRAEAIENPEDCKWSHPPVQTMLIFAADKIEELEAELAEVKRRAAWYLAYCDKCEFCFYAIYETDADRCESCHDSEIGEYKNFVLAPVPDDFEEVENG